MYRHNKEENLVSPASKFQKLVLGGLETLFYKYGKFVARYTSFITFFDNPRVENYINNCIDELDQPSK